MIDRLGSAYLGLIKWVAVNSAPSMIQSPPTTMYAIPRNGFRPPITVRVDISIDFVPLYIVTGKSSGRGVSYDQVVTIHDWSDSQS